MTDLSWLNPLVVSNSRGPRLVSTPSHFSKSTFDCDTAYQFNNGSFLAHKMASILTAVASRGEKGLGS